MVAESPKGTIIVLNQDPGAYARVLATQFLVQGLKEGDDCLYINYDIPAKHVRDGVEKFLPDFKLDGNFTILDAYTSSFHLNQLRPLNSGDLAKVLMQFNKVIERFQSNGNKHVRWVLDSYSTPIFISKNPTKAIIFIRNIIARIRENKHTALFIQNRGVLPHQIETAFDHFVDGVIDFRTVLIDGGPQKILRIRKFPTSNYCAEEVLYQITEAKNAPWTAIKKFVLGL